MSANADSRLGRIGIWSLELRFGDLAARKTAAAELDELGFGAIWIPGGVGGDVFSDVDTLLGATKRAQIATGIINVWKHEPAEITTWFAALPADHQSRLMLGLGISHQALIGEAYAKPLAAMRDYLAKLETLGQPANSMCLAALGPKMLALSRDRTAGAHPYLTTPEHTVTAREILGPGKLLAPEQGVVLETDPAKARALAREALAGYQQLENYCNSWRRLGFSEDDIANGSDALVDALFAWGTPEKIAERVDAHIAAGADHVCLQLITGAGMDIDAAMVGWRQLATLL
jgi:probable F420-dependent oxidoreductase